MRDKHKKTVMSRLIGKTSDSINCEWKCLVVVKGKVRLFQDFKLNLIKKNKKKHV